MAVLFPGARQFGSFLAGWRGLGRFWAAVILLLGTAAAVLQVIGPTPKYPPGPALAVDAPVVRPGPASAEHDASDAKPRAGPPPTAQASLHPERPGRDLPGPVGDPDPALLTPFEGGANAGLPRIAVDGRTPMAVYAAGFDPTSVRPRVGMLIAGIGMSEADSLAAIKNLPGGVTLAITPYANAVSHLLDVARMTEHEYLLAIPMEPQGYPVNDPDDRHALMTSLPPAENLLRLRWVLSRLSGYVGVTNALGTMRGERLAGVPDQLGFVLEEVGHRGLLFIDARSSQAVLPYVWNRSVNMVIDDDPFDATVLDQRLDLLTHAALDKGSALGIVLVPRPVTLARVAAWTNTLAAKGVALAPVSALVVPPAKPEAEK